MKKLILLSFLVSSMFGMNSKILKLRSFATQQPQGPPNDHVRKATDHWYGMMRILNQIEYEDDDYSKTRALPWICLVTGSPFSFFLTIPDGYAISLGVVGTLVTLRFGVYEIIKGPARLTEHLKKREALESKIIQLRKKYKEIDPEIRKEASQLMFNQKGLEWWAYISDQLGERSSSNNKQ